MSRELFRITEKLYNTPHLISPTLFDSILTYLEDRNEGKIDLAIDKNKTRRQRSLAYNPDTRVGVISIDGPLTYIEHDPVCGEVSASYQQIQDEFEQLVDKGAKYVLLDVDSGGGEAFGMMETGRTLRSKSDAAGVKLIAYVDGTSASAAYGLTSAAHTVIMNPESEAGSIGVLVKLRNINKGLKANGIEDTYVYAGDSKIPFDAEGEWREDFIQDIQEKVDETYERFTSYVSEMRNIDVKAVRDTQARMFTAERAIEIGLADSIMTRESFFEYLADIVQNENKTMSLRTKKLENDPMKLEELQAELTAVQSKLETLSAGYETAKAALADKEASLEKMSARVTELESEKAKAEQDKEEQKQASRKEALSKVVAADKLEELHASLKDVNDVVFEAVVASLTVKADTEKQSEMFTEKGVGGEGKQVAKQSSVRTILQEKYKSNSGE